MCSAPPPRLILEVGKLKSGALMLRLHGESAATARTDLSPECPVSLPPPKGGTCGAAPWLTQRGKNSHKTCLRISALNGNASSSGSYICNTGTFAMSWSSCLKNDLAARNRGFALTPSFEGYPMTITTFSPLPEQ